MRGGVHVLIFVFSGAGTFYVIACFLDDDLLRVCWCDIHWEVVCSTCRWTPYLHR